MFGTFVIAFMPDTSNGSISCPGAQAGDKIISVQCLINDTMFGDRSADFGSTITTNDHIPQVNGFPSNTYICLAILGRCT